MVNNPFTTHPAPPGFGGGQEVPYVKASYISKLFFSWLTPFLRVGFSRPLEKDDFWSLPSSQQTATLTEKLERLFYSRCPLEKTPHYLQSEPKVPKQDESLFKTIHAAFFWRWWTAGAMKFIADILNTTTPLVSKVLLTWLAESYVFYRLSPDEQTQAAGLGFSKPQGIGYGIGLAFALFIMQETSSLMMYHYTFSVTTSGLRVRTGIIGNICRKAMRLSGHAKLEHSVGNITTMISVDVTKLDQLSLYAHHLWTVPLQLILGIGLLIGNLGYSALVGLGIMIFGLPLQFIFVSIMYAQQKKGVKITDSRLRLTTEVLQGIRLIKLYAWENFYINQIMSLRVRELATLRKSAVALGGLISITTFLPILCSTLSFITYSLSGHDLNVAVIFTSLQLFTVIQTPLLTLPLVLGALADAMVAFNRITTFLVAEERSEPFTIEKASENALEIDGDFTWEDLSEESKAKPDPPEVSKDGEKDSKKKSAKVKAKSKSKSTKVEKDQLPTIAPESENRDEVEKVEGNSEERAPFRLENLKMTVPKGKFVAIVGRVGSGKTSILQALIGEMRRTRGHAQFGGSIAYVPQTPWIKNATVRDNIFFRKAADETLLQKVIHACCLERDLAALPHGENTEIGEKGINLSGGQKARISLARAAYSDADIILLDDTLSAVDGFVAKALLDDCLLHGPLSNRTRIMVTHSLHILDKTDYIYMLEDGKITREGTYSELMQDSVEFQHLIEEYGNTERQGSSKATRTDKKAETDPSAKADGNKTNLMAQEEREIGAVSWSTYAKYLKYAGGTFWAILVLFLLALTQSTNVGSSLLLGFWTAESIPNFRQGDYIGLYAGFGGAHAVTSFMVFYAFAIVSLRASLTVFRAAFTRVLRSPTSFFDTTPIGRVISRLSKDVTTLDNELASTSYTFLTFSFSIFGTMGLVFYTFPLLGIIFAPLAVLYFSALIFYRRTSVETKRIDSLMRSAMYASYNETLTGLPTIRSYGAEESSMKDIENGLDMENRAYYMTLAIQQWLQIRLDVGGNLLILGIGLFAAGYRFHVDPAKIGVVLSYTLSFTQIFSLVISQFAQNEQNMNAVERILVYAELPSEAAGTTANDPAPNWPERGAVSFKDVKLAYREGLPLVLNDVNFDIKAGEKVGIVGRTGAGKSSLLQGLFRTTELQDGKIFIDDIDICDIGLDVLRNRLALVPQDNTLFSGTIRENLDPLRSRTDAELIAALQRAKLLPSAGSDPTAEAKFNLDAIVDYEGSNYSAGEKQLLSLARALAKNSRIIVLDEASASVDLETDAKLQKTIQTEFSGRTLLCIAHRLNTIVYYDRVLVMDDGHVVEFDSVLNLFDKEGGSVFRSLCDESGLTRTEIVRIREAALDVVVKMDS